MTDSVPTMKEHQPKEHHPHPLMVPFATALVTFSIICTLFVLRSLYLFYVTHKKKNIKRARKATTTGKKNGPIWGSDNGKNNNEENAIMTKIKLLLCFMGENGNPLLISAVVFTFLPYTSILNSSKLSTVDTTITNALGQDHHPLEKITVMTIASFMTFLIILFALLLFILHQLDHYDWFLELFSNSKKEAPVGSSDEMKIFNPYEDGTVGIDDMNHLRDGLVPSSNHDDVLRIIVTCPDSIKVSQGEIERREKLLTERETLIKERLSINGSEHSDVGGTVLGSSGGKDMTFNIDDVGGWDDNSDDEKDDNDGPLGESAEEKKERLRLKEAAENEAKEKKELAERVKAVSGRNVLAENIRLEGLDDNVIGQKWVEKELKEIGQWSIDDDDDDVSLRRNICMLKGRLNSGRLNTHPDLVKAIESNLIDQTYFRSTMSFRQRTGLLLEASMRVAHAGKSHRLACTLVEAVVMFRVGIPSVSNQKFVAHAHNMYRKQYGIRDAGDGVPKLALGDREVSTPGEKEVVTGDTLSIEVDVDRLHAEAFYKERVEKAKEQGIPPQVAMTGYREGWWLLIKCEKILTDSDKSKTKTKEGIIVEIEAAKERMKIRAKNLEVDQVFKDAEAGTRAKFADQIDSNVLLCAYPFIISNLGQKKGRVKVKCPAPEVPGTYDFHVTIKSQDFVGCDTEFKVRREVLDAAKVDRKGRKKDDEMVAVKGGKNDKEGKKAR